jgi:FkbM family methyltransferase
MKNASLPRRRFDVQKWSSNLARNWALRVPAIRRLYESRNAIDVELHSLIARLETSATPEAASPFFHYNASFDPIEVIRRHAASGLQARQGYVTNFLGVVIDPKIYPSSLSGLAGQIDKIPIPRNWHADIAEWGAALRAVDLACDTFTVIELGCGWGCWMNSTGVAAKRKGLNVHLIGVEGDRGHLAFARETCESNGFHGSAVTLIHGIAAGQAGTALFPRQDVPGTEWGSQPIFNAGVAERLKAVKSGKYDELPMVSLAEIVAPHSRIDLLHIDIQGGEADLISTCLPTIAEKVAYLVIGTHSRQIEGRLFETLLQAGWQLEIERPALLRLGMAPIVHIDGVQGWRNPKLLP